METNDHPGAEPKPAAAEQRAHAYEAVHNRLFLLRLLLTFALLAAYHFSGLSAVLAGGLRARFGDLWPLVNGLYLAVTLLAFSAVMFPLSFYGDYVVEHKFGLSRQDLESWIADYFKSLGLELALAIVFFEVVYAILRWAPATWWLWAAGFYLAFSVVLTVLGPVLILPLFHKFEPLDNPDLARAASEMAQREGLKVVGVYRWGLQEKTFTANAALAGLGRTRRIILGDTMLEKYTRDEILSVLAHELGHFKHGDMTRMIAVGTLLALGAFFAAHWASPAFLAGAGFRALDDIAAFPVLLFILFIVFLVTMPLTNAYSRRLEYGADRHAVRAMGGPAPLVSALEKLADQNLDEKNPPAWIEFLLHSHPSISRRIRRAQDADEQSKV
jgi:STE24 endopeptidase